MDLIKLDTSIELEDFDPLNQNAKPIPSLPLVVGRMNGSSSAINPVIVGGFNNPLYPYFEPPFMSTSPQPSAAAFGASGDDDSELLRKYGLDQLTLDTSTGGGGSGQTGAMKKTSTISGSGQGVMMDSAEAPRSHWTTFE